VLKVLPIIGGQEREIQVNWYNAAFYSCRSTNYFNIKLRFLLEISKLVIKKILFV
jgi:hypothetical protein